MPPLNHSKSLKFKHFVCVFKLNKHNSVGKEKSHTFQIKFRYCKPWLRALHFILGVLLKGREVKHEHMGWGYRAPFPFLAGN